MSSFSLFLFILSSSLIFSCSCKPNYCLPSNKTCWPTSSEITTFSSKLNGDLVLPKDANYDIYINMTQDLLYRNQYPQFIVICKSVQDIQESVWFASSHCIQISIISTGHSYSGRDTANNSLQINLSQMRGYKINTDSNGKKQSITVETGLQLGSVYGLAAPGIVIGPDDPSVGPGGSSLRGGHSPIGPAFGLMSDFTLEYFIVDSNAQIVHIYNTSGVNQTIDDLFWSLKGGGGSTFGVVVNITFKIHQQEPNTTFTKLSCHYNFYTDPIKRTNFIGDQIFNNLFQLIQNGTLDPYWGGYLLSYYDYLLISMNYYGNSSYAKNNAQPVFHLADPYKNDNGHCNFTVYDTWIEFQSTFGPDTGGSYLKLWNDLIPKENLTTEYTTTLTKFFNSSTILDGWMNIMCGVFQGGKINEFPDDYTAVTPGFRYNQFEIALGTAWSDTQYTDVAIQYANKWEDKFRKFGYGKYSNEENYSCGNGCDWKQLFYGQSHYQRLLKVKQKWDPNQVFWCNHCVGSDQ